MSKTDLEPEPLVAAMKVIDIYFWTWWRDNESLKEENLQVQMQINHLFNFQFLATQLTFSQLSRRDC